MDEPPPRQVKGTRQLTKHTSCHGADILIAGQIKISGTSGMNQSKGIENDCGPTFGE